MKCAIIICQHKEYNSACFDIYENGKIIEYTREPRFWAPYLRERYLGCKSETPIGTHFGYSDYPINFKLQISQYFTYDDREAEIRELQFKLGLGVERLSPEGLLMDQDYVAFIVDADGKLLSDSHFVFYNSDLRLRVVDPGWNPDLTQPLTIVHSDEWDNKRNLINVESRPTDPEISVIGQMEWARSPLGPSEFLDDAEIDINLGNINPMAHQIIICVYSYHRPLGETKAYFRLYNSNQERLKTELYCGIYGDFPSYQVLELCRIFKDKDIWKIKSSNKGYSTMEEILNWMGVSIWNEKTKKTNNMPTYPFAKISV